jgi:hypothetical protein
LGAVGLVWEREPVGDLIFVFVTVALFWLLWLAVRGVERL